ncbi:MAG: hypothetical protein GC182_16080 [Rhodopseudomonas sp.]|nr:hypothetical protein [Rhodopseudomonas sp.]
MPVSRILPILLTIAALALPSIAGAQGFMAVEPAAETARRACLDKAQQRAAVASHKAVPLAQAIRALRSHGHRAEVVRAELCRRGDGLVYVLTLLARSGKVTRAEVDAGNGMLISGR